MIWRVFLRLMKYTAIALLMALIVLIVYLVIPRPIPVDLEADFNVAYEKYRPYIKKDYAIIIDYRLPRYLKRLWVVDMNTGKIKMHTYVGHAWRSGKMRPTKFSNVPGSKMSCKGSFITSNSYTSMQYGFYAMRVLGLENGVNDNALKRYIVFHPPVKRADRRSVILSAGCFTLLEKAHRELIDLTKDGSFVFVYQPDVP
jgi:hypothetical protein